MHSGLPFGPELTEGGAGGCEPDGPARTVALLSLFDGLGTARLALQDALEVLGHPAALNFAGHAELHSFLASPLRSIGLLGRVQEDGCLTIAWQLMSGTC